MLRIDETYIGGKAKRRGGSRNQKPRSEKFDMVMGMRERKGRIRFVHIPDGKLMTIRKAWMESEIINAAESVKTLAVWIGSFHRLSIKHLHRYLSEFQFRFNVRKDVDRFSNTLRRMLGIEPMPYVELIGIPKIQEPF
jgi:hypothetical protein